MMKTVNRLLFGLVFTAVLTSAVPVRVNENAPVTAPVTVDALVKMNSREFAEVIGHKLSLKEKVVFRIAQRELRKEIKREGIQSDATLDVQQMMADGEKNFYFGGFILGLLLGLIGVLIAYLMKKDKAFIRSTWIGWGAWVVLLVILLASSGGTA
ncbi:MAG: hypothetical protein LW694_01530 [Chitinophagaceae bacterium]|jgi:hypothetical protein|nr:hypothetical protein [Chitinophagaceae bacterium]